MISTRSLPYCFALEIEGCLFGMGFHKTTTPPQKTKFNRAYRFFKTSKKTCKFIWSGPIFPCNQLIKKIRVDSRDPWSFRHKPPSTYYPFVSYASYVLLSKVPRVALNYQQIPQDYTDSIRSKKTV